MRVLFKECALFFKERTFFLKNAHSFKKNAKRLQRSFGFLKLAKIRKERKKERNVLFGLG